MDNLLIRNQVYRNLNVISRSVLPADFSFQMTNLSVRIGQEVISVRGDIVAPVLFTLSNTTSGIRGERTCISDGEFVVYWL
jgi:hypothetical protein